MDRLENRKIWIIGASSGIGAALARELSRRGAILTLSARRADELEKVCAGLKGGGAIIPLDVTDAGAVQGVMDSSGPFDSVIFMAAIYKPGLIEDMTLADARGMVDVNIVGALNTIHAVYPSMRRAGRGQIVLCGSVAGYCGLPRSQPYSLTKAAVMSLAQSLRAEAERYNIDVKLISPGFVRTPMTEKNKFAMPMIVEPEEAAVRIADGLTRPGFEIHFPRKFTWFVKALGLLPYGIYFRVARSILRRKAGGR